MEHGLAALVLADRIPRTDANLEKQKMIEFAIDVFLMGVTEGPDKLARMRG
jgi:hypothetical protein